MSQAALENLARIGKLQPEAPSRVEFGGLLQSARRRLADAELAALSAESRFTLAYLRRTRWHWRRCAMPDFARTAATWSSSA